MKLVCFDEYRIGVVIDGAVRDVTDVIPSALDALPAHRMNWLIANWSDAADAVGIMASRGGGRPLAEVRLRTPVPRPGHVFAAPANYRSHIGELKERAVTKAGRSAREQGFFLKAPGSVVGAHDEIVLPKGSGRRFDHESELAVIVGRAGRNVSRASALDHVFGYACLMDITMRIEPGTGEEERSMRKSFSSFTPIGPWIVTADEVGDPGELANQLYVNDDLRQDANTSDMIVDVAELIELVSSVLPIEPGDIIATGTPAGVGQIVAGDRVRIVIERVGEMALNVVEADHVAPRAY
ncbi:fumarylacetoacetate hydrolase family protein [Sphingomonas sp. LB2R24]|uniref:fumarylacetoacetate hydrolase family protein n=1 Tax=Sphingomonas sorbitolis TaxID=3096165 RepID=UPI002FC98394